MDEDILRREKLGLVIVTTLFLVPILFFIFFLWRAISVPQVLAQPTTIVIKPKAGFLEISDVLAKEGIVARPSAFRAYVLFRGWAGSLKTGHYVFKGPVSISEVARYLVEGSGDITVTIPEGYTAREIARAVSGAGLAQENDILEIVKTPEIFSYPFLNSETESLEGFLFPDTYRFSSTMSSREIVGKMLDNFEQKAWVKIPEGSRNASTFYDVLTTASLLEKETPHSQDRKIIAGILSRRLKASRALEVDATVIYAWKLRDPDWKPKDHSLTRSQLQIVSPYNTYRVRGLPPTPISNPSQDAIWSALSPAPSDYWYYLSTREGVTIFSRTFEEHQRAKAKYL